MVDQESETERQFDYPILVRRHNGIYDLRIEELLLISRGADFQQTYKELMERKQHIVDCARTFDLTSELPQPNLLPLCSVADHRRSLLYRILSKCFCTRRQKF